MQAALPVSFRTCGHTFTELENLTLACAFGSLSTLQHTSHILGLSNASCEEDLDDWEEGLRRRLPGEEPTYVAELKIDGSTVAIRYTGGKLDYAIRRRRSNELERAILTRNIKTIPSLPRFLPEPLDLEVGGAIYYPLSSFADNNELRERRGETPFKNPRNATEGILHLLSVTEVAKHGLDIGIYDLCSSSPWPTHAETLDWLAFLGFPVAEHWRRCDSLEAVKRYYREWITRRTELDYQIDGILVKVDQLALRDQAGSTRKFPRWAAALKFPT